jgi:hypothetical protein
MTPRDDLITLKYITLMKTEPHIYIKGGMSKQSRVLEKLMSEYKLKDSSILAIITATKKRWKNESN